MYKPLPEKLSYPAMELDILQYWKQNKIFEKSLKIREGKPFYSFYEGPPTVNGSPGIHHVMARAIKDIICRYKTMQGFYVRRQAGWDTHGLPVEISVEQKLGLHNKTEIEQFGIDKFNAECKKFVYKNIEMDQGWRSLTERMGYWVDLDSAYITCTNEYIESVWWALKTFFDKGLIYKGFKVVPQSPTIETPLSSHELSLGYKDVRDPNCYLKLKILSSPIKELEKGYVLVWTTTPWTLFANVALAVGEEIDYVLVENIRKQKDTESKDYLILAHQRINVLEGEINILSEFKGKDILGTHYEQIFKYIPIDREKYPNALTILPGDFVSTEDGSGVVHLAPAFGEDDYIMSKKFNLPFQQPVTPNGHFTKELGEFAGRAIKTFKYSDHIEEGSDRDIIYALKQAGKIYKSSFDYVHSYPHCWRTGNPVMYYARESWFIKSPEYKHEMIELNKQINWQPPEIGSGRFGNWLEEVKEWSLSRDRFWGTPLPLWVSEDNNEVIAIGSIKELKEGLYENSDGSLTPLKDLDLEIDLHRPFVDRVIFIKNGKKFLRTPEVVDVWFDSGSMPFAQMHYPFENQELFSKMFPADFIAEGIDQTRGWFYTLHNIAVALFNKPAYLNIIVNELILDENGRKMSKSLGNTVNPFEVINEFGADAVRWYLLVNNPPWKSTLFNTEDIKKTVISDFFRSITNIYAFFALYANIDGFKSEEPEITLDLRPEIDRWLISRINSVIADYIKYMDNYDITKANRVIQDFSIYEFSNWYIRLNRRRFWKGEYDNDKISAYQTLRYVLIQLLKLISPTSPFLAEDIYLRLKKDDEPQSIHLCDLPNPIDAQIDHDLERKMALAQKVVTLSRFLREKSKIRVRQPLQRILIPVLNPQQRRDIQHFEAIIKDEINIKSIEYLKGETDIVQKKAKPNFKSIGKKFGKNAQIIANAIKNMSNEDIKLLEKKGSFHLNINGNTFELITEDVEIISEDIEGWLVASDEGISVALDTQLNDELIAEGIAREFVNRIQNLRKKSGFNVTDRIIISYFSNEYIQKAIDKKMDYISNETLAEKIIFEKIESGLEIDIDDNLILVKLIKL